MREREYVRSLFGKEDDVLKSIAPGLEERDMPQISVPPEVGKTLYLLAKMSGAKRVLEIGALGGYSTIWLARALPESGKVVSLEISQKHADFAAENVAKAGLKERVTFLVGDAMQSLDTLARKGERFDFFFIDADKPNYINYLEKVIQLSEPGAVITADNLFQHGRIFDDQDQAPSPRTIRQFNEQIANDPRLESMLLTIGDGLGVCRVKEKK
ncbi:O-methyltransferase [Lihuaxuella thermophila]|uniref:Predicted O-methyltransferase YrrM n=1 Tax=Lihuaxuella thermophila TaxID=1173111 RepID=A0A1H8DGU3_9BACL|nr:O-methyltransferase [Lihuaxuella thermophila]SEN06024.1 Predicted O-methyltransferase YrrM [Lihuaxuella thermophila]